MTYEWKIAELVQLIKKTYLVWTENDSKLLLYYDGEEWYHQDSELYFDEYDWFNQDGEIVEEEDVILLPFQDATIDYIFVTKQ